jgi:hypothetical protein
MIQYLVYARCGAVNGVPVLARFIAFQAVE